jgi:hypothetical protein
MYVCVYTNEDEYMNEYREREREMRLNLIYRKYTFYKKKVSFQTPFEIEWISKHNNNNNNKLSLQIQNIHGIT